MSLPDMSRRDLLDLIKNTKDRIASLMMTKVDPDKETERDNLIIGYEKDLKDFVAALAAKKEPDDASPNDTNLTLEYNRISNSIQARVTDIGHFRPDSGLINNFILKLDNLYSLLVKDNLSVHAGLERNFVTMVILMLPTTAQTKFQASTTWTDLKTKLREFYQADISIFQHLGRLWDFNPDSQNWSEIASQLTAICNESKNTIKQRFESDGKTLTADHVFDLMSAMLLSELIRGSSPEIYRSMIEKLDSCKTATDVALAANFFKDRLSDEHFSSFKATAERTRFQRMIKGVQNQVTSKSKRNITKQSDEDKELVKQCIKEKVCIRYNLGQKCKSDPCPYDHRKLSEANPKSTFLSEVSDWSEDLFPEGN